MKLHSPDRMAHVPHGVDFSGIVDGGRGHLQHGRQRGGLHHQRVVAHDLERARNTVEEVGPVVADLRSLSVHHAARSANDLAAVRFPDGLMAETHAENRDVRAVSLDERDADPRLARCLRSGADDDRGRAQRTHVLHRDRIVTNDAWILAKLAEILDEVVRERIVVVDDEQHAENYLSGARFSKS